VRIVAIILIAAAVYIVTLCASLIIKFASDGHWDDPNGRKVIYAIAFKGFLGVFAASHGAWMTWRKKPAALVK
jgi:hypothetical protein